MTSRPDNPLARAATFIGLGAIGFVALAAFDRALLDMLRVEDVRKEDWWMALRTLGYVPAWLVAALALVLLDADHAGTGRTRWTRGVFLTLSVLAAGAAAEILKILIRRQRPGEEPGYTFRPLAEDTLSSSGLGLPSSHAAVAFAGAFALCFVFPRAAPLWIALGVGCALSRVADGAHYPTDTYAAALMSYAVVALLARAILPRTRHA